MKKLNLHVEELAVESFETAGAEPMRGTVRGYGDSSNCSYGSPGFTGCRLTCAFECGESEECTPACPNGGTGGCGTGGTGGTGGSGESCNTGCRITCLAAC